MTMLRKGLVLAAFQCALALSVSGKLLYDRATRPHVWVKAAQWDPSLPLRGRYLALRLDPQPGEPWFNQLYGQRVVFFVPEHTLPFENTTWRRSGPELWVEVTIPRHGPPRAIRLGMKQDGKLEPLALN